VRGGTLDKMAMRYSQQIVSTFNAGGAVIEEHLSKLTMIDAFRLLDLVGIEVRVENDLGCFLKGFLVVYVSDVILYVFFSDAFLLSILVRLVNIICRRLETSL
jgi:hypothetical protein